MAQDTVYGRFWARVSKTVWNLVTPNYLSRTSWTAMTTCKKIMSSFWPSFQKVKDWSKKKVTSMVMNTPIIMTYASQKEEWRRDPSMNHSSKRKRNLRSVSLCRNLASSDSKILWKGIPASIAILLHAWVLVDKRNRVLEVLRIQIPTNLQSRRLSILLVFLFIIVEPWGT